MLCSFAPRFPAPTPIGWCHALTTSIPAPGAPFYITTSGCVPQFEDFVMRPIMKSTLYNQTERHISRVTDSTPYDLCTDPIRSDAESNCEEMRRCRKIRKTCSAMC